MTHVQMVSKIGRTIGRALCLNEDLIEAAALGHDLGHVPFGHLGEKILNDLSLEYGEGYFNHNVQSVRILTNLENGGKGANITLQVLDAIMCHNGELELKEYRPKEKTKFDFIKEYKKTYIDKSAVTKLVPMTLEGCVVRVSDIIAYIGKDVEDAIRMHLIRKEEIPANVRKTLGTSNSEIINTIINDIVSNSLDKPYIKMSDNIFKALVELKKFNYEYIYSKANTEQDIQMYKKIFKTVFEYNLEQLSKENRKSHIYTLYLNDMSEIYLNKTNNIRKVIDYIAGMTDDFIVTEYNHIAK
jgi:dGTPase